MCLRAKVFLSICVLSEIPIAPLSLFSYFAFYLLNINILLKFSSLCVCELHVCYNVPWKKNTILSTLYFREMNNVYMFTHTHTHTHSHITSKKLLICNDVTGIRSLAQFFFIILFYKKKNKTIQCGCIETISFIIKKLYFPALSQSTRKKKRITRPLFSKFCYYHTMVVRTHFCSNSSVIA